MEAEKRKAFIRKIKEEGPKDLDKTCHGAQSGVPPSDVPFTLTSLIEFKSFSDKKYKVPKQKPTKRPGYDGTRRRMFANQVDRKKYLILIQKSFVVFVILSGCIYLLKNKMHCHYLLLIRHADNGRSQQRVRNLFLKDRCHCDKLKCFRRMIPKESDLDKFLEIFWDMEKPSQDAYVPNLFRKVSSLESTEVFQSNQKLKSQTYT